MAGRARACLCSVTPHFGSPVQGAEGLVVFNSSGAAYRSRDHLYNIGTTGRGGGGGEYRPFMGLPTADSARVQCDLPLRKLPPSQGWDGWMEGKTFHAVTCWVVH